MFGVAATGGRIERRAARRLSTWTRDYLRQVALADLGCAVVGVFVAVGVLVVGTGPPEPVLDPPEQLDGPLRIAAEIAHAFRIGCRQERDREDSSR